MRKELRDNYGTIAWIASMVIAAGMIATKIVVLVAMGWTLAICLGALLFLIVVGSI